jgi:hypothetical protein
MEEKYFSIVKEKHPHLFKPVLTEQEINQMDRQQLIKAICEHHPAQGTKEGYSWYIGGMADTGAWLPDKMHYMYMYDDSPYKQLLLKLEQDKEKGNKWNIENLYEYYRMEGLPEPERTETRNKRFVENQEKEKTAWNKIIEDIEMYAMWGKNPETK